MHESLTVRLFGAPQISLGDTPVTDFITRKAEALFLYLVATQRPHTRDTLASLLWVDADQQRTKKNLRDILPNLRERFGEYLLITRDSITFNTALPYWVDLERFQTQLQPITPSIAEIHTAVGLYRGEFLEGFHVRGAPNFEEWMLLERERLHEAYIQGLHTLADHHIERQDYFAALVITQRLLAIEPWQEKAHRQQMISLAGSGRINEALAQYATCRRILADELGLAPMTETTALYEQLRNGAFTSGINQWPGVVRAATSELPLHPTPIDPGQPNSDKVTSWSDSQPAKQAAPPVTPSPPHSFSPLPPHNLPRQLTPFFGRSFEIGSICAKLQHAECAWLTLTGVGGVGKTRLALKVGETLLPYFRDGVWFVSLLDIIPGETLAEQLVTAIGKALQISFTGAESLTPQLFTHLREKQLLLILDNFEHLAGAVNPTVNNATQPDQPPRNPAADCVHNLLQETQQVKVLITSRHCLNYQAEHLFTIDGLPLPEPDEVEAWAEGAPTLDQLLHYDSIALFVQRAAHSIAHFAFNEENASAIMQICRLVEGLPLGIELAATLVRRYSCDQIAARLAEHYTILTTTFHDLPMRHRSIEATLAYSWQLLSAVDRLVFAQCAIFPDSFTLTAATEITGATAPQLQHLEGQMLLQQVAPKRYTMHRLMRQYALQQLQKMPTVEQHVRERHCLYFVEFLKKLAERSPLNAQSFDIIHAEMGDIYIGWEWAVQQGKFALLAQILPLLVRIYALSGSHREIAALLGQTTADLKARFAEAWHSMPDLQQIMAQLLLEQAYFYITSDRIERAKPLIDEALHVAQHLGDSNLTLMVYERSGDAAWAQGDYVQHRLAYEQALALARATGHHQSEVHCLSNLGMNDDMLCEYSRAIQSYAAALALTRQIGDREKENVIYNNLGVSSALLGDFTQALAYYQETIQLSRQLGDQEGSGFANLNLGLLYNTLGQWERARYYGERALKIFRMINDRRLEGRTLVQLGFTLHQMGETTTAASSIQQALQIAHKGGYQAVQAEVLTVWGQILLDRQEGAKAVTLFREAYTLWQLLGRTRRALVAQGGLVESLHFLGDYTGALELVNEILSQVASSPGKGAMPPESVLLSCYYILQYHSDGRAAALLQRAYQLLMAKANKLQAPDLRHSFLYQVKTHRELLALAPEILHPGQPSAGNASK